MGQQKEVTTVRFFVKDTFVEVCLISHMMVLNRTKRPMLTSLHRQRILDLQQSKRKLEEVLLGLRRGGKQQNERLSWLEVCLLPRQTYLVFFSSRIGKATDV